MMNSKFFFLAAAIVACLVFPLSLTAAEHTIGQGGGGHSYGNLNALYTVSNSYPSTLNNGDSIVFTGNDSSLTAAFTSALAGKTITLKGTGIITPAGANGIFSYNTCDVIFDSDSLEFRNFKGASSRIFYVRNATIVGGSNTFADNSTTNMNGAVMRSANLTISGGTNLIDNNINTSSTYGGGAIWVETALNITGGTNTFSGNSAATGGAIYTTGTAIISDGTNTFSGNSARNGTGGAINSTSASGVAISGGTNEFTGNSATEGGAIRGSTVTLSGGENTFSNNRSNASGANVGGGAISGTTTIKGGTNTFESNTASNGGAINRSSANLLTSITGGTNKFIGNTASSQGGAIWGFSNISGGTNTFTGNTANEGGAMYGSSGVTLSNGTNTFSGNTANTSGGAIYGITTINGGINTFTNNKSTNGYGGAIYSGSTVTLSGGTNEFTGNTSRNLGGAIYADGALTLRASNGDFTFRGNRDQVGRDTEKANAIYVTASNLTVTLAAAEGQSIYFYDPITTNSTSHSILINNQTTDTGKVVFDGSDYARAVDRISAVYGTTTVGYGELALKGGAIYGEANNSGTFTLGQNATLSSAFGNNEIRANQITMNGIVDIGSGSSLALSTSGGSYINGTVALGLGIDSWGSLSALGNLSFGNNALLSVYGDDLLGAVTDGWSNTYNLFDTFSATGNINGLANLMFDASWFDAYDGFSYEWRGNGVLFLSYSEVPEPATLLMLGLGLAGLPIVRRLRKRQVISTVTS